VASECWDPLILVETQVIRVILVEVEVLGLIVITNTKNGRIKYSADTLTFSSLRVRNGIENITVHNTSLYKVRLSPQANGLR